MVYLSFKFKSLIIVKLRFIIFFNGLINIVFLFIGFFNKYVYVEFLFVLNNCWKINFVFGCNFSRTKFVNGGLEKNFKFIVFVRCNVFVCGYCCL